MPELTTAEAAERLAGVVETARPTALDEFRAELFPEGPSAAPPSAAELARYIRGGLQAEEIVDLWNVVFPADRNVWYDEEGDTIHYDKEAVGHAGAD